MKLTVVGLGPGAGEDLTGRARRAIEEADLVVGYTAYITLIRDQFPGKEMISTGMKQEADRCRLAVEAAAAGKNVAVVCSGDAGIYGMAGLLYEAAQDYPSIDIEVVPGVTAACGGAAVLGAPLAHDFAVISLSDLLTPGRRSKSGWRPPADFVICLYNPRSRGRADYLRRACDILLARRAPDTVCGFVQNIGRAGERAVTLTLAQLRENTEVDMFTTVFIGSSETALIGEKMVTPRGYRRREGT